MNSNPAGPAAQSRKGGVTENLHWPASGSQTQFKTNDIRRVSHGSTKAAVREILISDWKE
jgi:hypothetical protein